MRITDADRARLEAASKGVGPFVNPLALREARTAIAQAPQEWLIDVLGRIPQGGVRYLTPQEMAIVSLAAQEFPPTDYPSPTRDAARLAARVATAEREAVAQAEQKRQRDEWASLRASLPVPVFVGHNWSLGHYEMQTTGKDHIVVQTAVSVGRLRREARKALCETPSKEYDLRALERTAETSAGSKDDDRLPTCAACLRFAKKIAGKD